MSVSVFGRAALVERGCLEPETAPRILHRACALVHDMAYRQNRRHGGHGYHFDREFEGAYEYFNTGQIDT
jgi:hypothetical protein